MSHRHREGWPDCAFRTKKECAENYADWQAMQQVLLAYQAVIKPDGWKPYKKDDSQFGQLVRLIAGQQDYIKTMEGNPSVTPWVARLMAAIERVKAGKVPGYNLYMPAAAGTAAGGT